MMVMRYVDFVQQGGIPRSDVAKRKGLLVTFDETQHIAVFVSHTWWLRPKDATSHDTGQPDYQEGDKANLKYRTTVRGVERLIEERGLDRSKVVLWIDWPQRSRALDRLVLDRAGRPRAQARGRREPYRVRDAVRVHAHPRGGRGAD